MEELARQYSSSGVANFAYIYIKEAHPEDEWQVENNTKNDIVFDQPKSFEERCDLASKFQEAMKTSTTILVDDIANTANTAYAAWPERIYVIGTDGRITYKGGMGPFFFDPDAIVPVLEKGAIKAGQRPS